MALKLDTVVRHGRWRIAALCEAGVAAFPAGGRVLAHGRKIPAAVVMSDGAQLFAFDLLGRALNPERLDAACPGLLAALGHPGDSR